MSGKSKRNLKILAGLVVLLLANLACASLTVTWCEYLDGGDWVVESGQGPLDGCCKTDTDKTVANKCKDNNAPSNQLPDPESESAPVDNPPQEEAPPVPPDSASFDPASCLPQPTDYTLQVVNFSDRSSDVKRSCDADDMITNNSNQALMFAIFRVNNYGAEETRYPEGRWGYGYQTIGPGETIEYGSSHRCTGGVCGAGEWFYIDSISILYYTPACSQYSYEHDEKLVDSIVYLSNPCDW